jgi:hypothetical protein
MEEEEVKEEDEEVEEEEEEEEDGCRARMGETWDACARTNGSDRCGAETTRHHIDHTEQRQIRLSLRATLVMLPMQHQGLASTPTRSTPAVSAILKLCSINLGTAEEAAVLFATTTRATRETYCRWLRRSDTGKHASHSGGHDEAALVP